MNGQMHGWLNGIRGMYGGIDSTVGGTEQMVQLIIGWINAWVRG